MDVPNVKKFNHVKRNYFFNNHSIKKLFNRKYNSKNSRFVSNSSLISI